VTAELRHGHEIVVGHNAVEWIIELASAIHDYIEHFHNTRRRHLRELGIKRLGGCRSVC